MRQLWYGNHTCGYLPVNSHHDGRFPGIPGPNTCRLYQSAIFQPQNSKPSESYWPDSPMSELFSYSPPFLLLSLLDLRLTAEHLIIIIEISPLETV